jgi:hypothetical protein
LHEEVPAHVELLAFLFRISSKSKFIGFLPKILWQNIKMENEMKLFVIIMCLISSTLCLALDRK